MARQCPSVATSRARRRHRVHKLLLSGGVSCVLVAAYLLLSWAFHTRAKAALSREAEAMVEGPAREGGGSSSNTANGRAAYSVSDLSLDTELMDARRAEDELSAFSAPSCPNIPSLGRESHSTTRGGEVGGDSAARGAPNPTVPPPFSPIKVLHPLRRVKIVWRAVLIHMPLTTQRQRNIIASALSTLRCIFGHGAVDLRPLEGDAARHAKPQGAAASDSLTTVYTVLPLSWRPLSLIAPLRGAATRPPLYDEFGFIVDDSGVIIFADTPAAVFHALLRIKQSLGDMRYALDYAGWQRDIRFGGVELLGAELARDGAAHAWRAVMLDVSRHFFDVTEVQQLLLHMAELHLGVLHWHLTDDQGWRIEIPSLPHLTSIGGRRGYNTNSDVPPKYNDSNSASYLSPRFYSTEDVHSVLRLARLLHIQVVPEIDVPAHSAAFLRAIDALHDVNADVVIIQSPRTASAAGAYDRLSIAKGELAKIGVIEIHEGCLARSPRDPEGFVGAVNCMGGTHGMLIPSSTTIALLKHIFSFLASQVFVDSAYFHLGGDEAGEFRDTVYDSEFGRMMMDEAGVESAHDLQIHLMNTLRTHIASLGRAAIAWDDTFLPSADPTSAIDTIVMWWRDWHPAAKWETGVKRLPAKKILAPHSMAYFDTFQFESQAESRFRVQDGTVTMQSVLRLRQFYADKFTAGIFGVEACLWSETLQNWTFVEYQLLPRAFALATASWSPAMMHEEEGVITEERVRRPPYGYDELARDAEVLLGHYRERGIGVARVP